MLLTITQMPFYRFSIHGRDTEAADGTRGFYTTRHAFGASEQIAAKKVLKRLETEFTMGVSAHFWKSSSPAMTVEDSWKIGMHQLWSAPNSGSTFYEP